MKFRDLRPGDYVRGWDVPPSVGRVTLNGRDVDLRAISMYLIGKVLEADDEKVVVSNEMLFGMAQTVMVERFDVYEVIYGVGNVRGAD
jgi:hypothetical protein